MCVDADACHLKQKGIFCKILHIASLVFPDRLIFPRPFYSQLFDGASCPLNGRVVLVAGPEGRVDCIVRTLLHSC